MSDSNPDCNVKKQKRLQQVCYIHVNIPLSTDHLTPVFTTIFHKLLELLEAPSCFKHSIVAPPSQNEKPAGMAPWILWSWNLLRVWSWLTWNLWPPLLEPLEFVFWANDQMPGNICTASVCGFSPLHSNHPGNPLHKPGQAQENLILHPNHLHWSPSGMCAPPPTLFPLK